MSLLYRWLLVLLALLYFVWFSTRKAPGPSWTDFEFIEDRSLTVILPVIQSTLDSLEDVLAPFLVPTTTLYEVAIVCPNSLISYMHRTLRVVLSNAPRDHTKVSLYPWSGLVDQHRASLDVIARIKTQWVLLLDEHGFKQVAECDRTYLLHPRAAPLPAGPRGFMGSSSNRSQLRTSDLTQPAEFLVPPFVAPSGLLVGAPLASPPSVWPALGHYIAKSTGINAFGGIVIGPDIMNGVACHFFDEEPDEEPDLYTFAELGSIPISSKGLFVLAFPHKEDLVNFIPTACKLCHQRYTVIAYLYDTDNEAEPSGVVRNSDCTIRYFRRSEATSTLSDWLNFLGSVPDILIGLDHQDIVSSTFTWMLDQHPFLNTTLMRLPRWQLPYTEWIGTLSLEELRHWNVPEISLSVITNDRPHSFRRLLESIQRTLFYGDKVNIRINMDQTSDPETLRTVHGFEWPHGDIFIHHRVIHGGLLPAVVESWYPHCDDSYGLLLEDDVELSPLSYAWVKMTLLRYKYGGSSPSSARLFGISLYQQKIIELRTTGRQPFDPRALFRATSIPDPTTPYLSQIPCSWGALYFPTPWREFHDYLALRLSQSALPLGHVVVPSVRSNLWTRSWKKFFIELVYLRGYVMLYPNYDGFASLSTNHLEVGSHVRDDPGGAYARRKPWFALPLMRLEGALARAGGEAVDGALIATPRLLDLPGEALPEWDQLPVLDLLGEVTSLEAIQRRGDERRRELDACEDAESLPSTVRDLLCHNPV